MDFLDPVKRRNHTIRLFMGYILVSIAILLATTILIYYAYGFNVTRDGSLIQKGLVFVSSQPSGADVYVDGELKKSTNAKLNLAADTYDIRLSRDGYHDWQRTIPVDGGSVNHYVYPLLIPTELTTETIDTLSAKPRLVTQSRDQRWLVVQPTNGDTFTVYDLSRGQDAVGEAVTFDVPEELVTASENPARWEVIGWSTNNRHMLMKRHYTTEDGNAFEYMLVDRQRPEGSHNLTRELNIEPAVEVKLRDDNPELYYLYDPQTKDLSSASLGDPEPQVIVGNVLDYKSHDGSRVLYATDEDTEKGQADIMLKEGDRTHFIRSVAESDTYLLDIARYDGSWYMVAGSKAENRTYLFKDPVASIRSSAGGRPASTFGFNVPGPTRVSFSANAQFIMVQSRANMHVYDAENLRAFRYETPFVIDGPERYATWMDGHRLSYVSNGNQVLFDYDNINRHTLVPSHQDFGGFYDRDFRFLYTLTPTETEDQTGWQLRSTPLLAPNDL